MGVNRRKTLTVCDPVAIITHLGEVIAFRHFEHEEDLKKYPDRRWEEAYRPEWAEHLMGIKLGWGFSPTTYKDWFHGEAICRRHLGPRKLTFGEHHDR